MLSSVNQLPTELYRCLRPGACWCLDRSLQKMLPVGVRLFMMMEFPPSRRDEQLLMLCSSSLGARHRLGFIPFTM